RTQTLGGQQLLLAYFVQRYGEMPFLDLFAQTSVGIAPLDAVLNAHALIDPVTGAPITARDTFADFVMTNALNLPFGDGRYVHTRIPLPQNTIYAAAPLTLGEPLGAMTVNQFGAQVFRYRAPQDSILAIRFDGAETAARLPMPASTGD